jgi:hypothetical protein
MTPFEQGVRDDLAGLWQMLAEEEIRDLRQAKSNILIGGRAVGVALDSVGARYLVIPCNAGRDVDDLWKGAVVVLSRRNLVGTDGVSGTCLLLKCLRADLEDVFLRLAANICGAMAGQNEGASQQVCISVLEAWRELVGAEARSGFGRQKAIGLLGELLVLGRLAEIDGRAALQAWQGPVGGRHDFRYGSRAIEAKATTSRVGRLIGINGARQLESPVAGQLYLSWARLENVPNGSISVRRTVDRLVGLGLDGERLRGLLAQCGYDAAERSEAADMTFELHEWLLWNVDESFPKVIPQSFAAGELPPGVVEMSYTIDCSAVDPLMEAASRSLWSTFLT